MNRAQMLLIKAQCIFFATEEEMSIIEATDKHFRAKGSHTEIFIDYESIFNAIQNGWNVMEVLQNETCYVEAV